MSVDSFYSVTRANTPPGELFAAICAASGVGEVSLHLEPGDLDDVDVSVRAFGLGEAFTQVTCEAPVDDPVDDLRRRLADLPALASVVDRLESLTLRYELRRSTTELWPELGKKRRTSVDLRFAVGVDLRQPAVALGVGLDISRVRMNERDTAEVLAWWRARHHRFLDERLARLGERARFDLDWNEPAVLDGTPAVTIVDEWGHLSYPTVLVARPPEALIDAAIEAMAGLAATHRVLIATGPASAIAALRGWLPTPTGFHGPSPFEPLPLGDLTIPRSFRGRLTMTAALDPGDLFLHGGPSTRLVLAVRGCLQPADERRLERALAVKLAHEHD